MATDHDDLSRWTDAQLSELDRQNHWQPDTNRAFAQFQHASRRDRHRGRQWALSGTLVAATSAGVMAFPPTHQFAQRCFTVCVDQSSKLCAYLLGRGPGASGEADAVLEESARVPAPNFSLPDRSGRMISIADYRGQVVLLNFWATWCSPCKREMPWLIEFQNQYRDRGFTVLGVSLDEDGWTSVARYLDETAINYPVLLATEDIVKRYGGVGAVPMTFVIDREGRIAATHVGLLNRDDLEREILKLLGR